jgi:hypothetical protein
MASLLSGVKWRNFCRIGLAWGLPCEYVSVILQELDERAFLFVTQAGTDDSGLALIGKPKIDSLGFFSRPHRGHDLSFIRGYREVFLSL